MMRILSVCIILIGTLFVTSSADSIPEAGGQNAVVEFTLAQEGKPACSLVIAEHPTNAARLAAMEIQFHVLKITGAELPIRTDKEITEGPKILVGDSEAARALGFRGSEFPAQEYLIAFRPDTLILIGRDWEDTEANRKEYGRPMSTGDTLAATRHTIDLWKTVGMPDRSTSEVELPGVYDDQGTSYAAYHFLEQFCDVRWYGPNETSIIFPERSVLTVKGTDVRRSPALKYRDALWSGNWPFMKGQWGPVTPQEVYLFWRRLRLGGEKWAGNHTFHRKTVETIFTNPAYQAEGKGRGSQLCYTSPELVREVAQIARDFFDGKKEAPEGWKAVGDYFALIPDDNSNYCRCDRCRELIYSGKSMRTGQFSSGTISNYFFSFVNAVAREVGKTHPDKYIATLAYWNYAFPPEFEMEPNVSMAPCLHTCMYAIHKEIRENDMKLYHEWLERSKAPLHLWNYYHHPMEPAVIEKFHCFPNVMVHKTAETMRMFIEDGVRGIFICGEQDMLEGYVIAKVWDDSALEVDALLDEFFQRYFGAAAGPMKQFYLQLEQIACNPENYPAPYYRGNGIDWKNVAWTALGTEERMKQLGILIAEAQQLAQTDLEKRRVALWHDALWQWMVEGRASADALP